jgi:N-acetylmuramoyl-L-alanine amidase
MRFPTRSFRALVPSAITGLVVLAGSVQPAIADDPQTTGKFTTVLLDAGHGGKDNGGTSGSKRPFQREKDLTLDTVFRIRDLLKRARIHVILTRNSDYFIELDDRVAMANKLGAGAVLISIHYNAVGSSDVRGAKTYFWHASSHGIATRIQQHLVAATREPDNGVTRRRLRLTRNPEIPGVLCECAYLTSPIENRLVADPNYRQRIAEGIASGIVEQCKIGDAGIPSVPEIWAPMSRATDPRE